MADIRRLTPEDAPQTLALIQSVFAELAPRIDPPSGARNETVATIAASDGAVAVENGRILACILWQEKDGGLYFGRLAVHASARGQGLAKSLISETEAEARRRALPFVHLGVRLSLPENRRFFASLGYIETRQTTHPGYDHPTSADMVKHLA